MIPLAPSLQSEFPVEENRLYLNHAAVAPWPKRTALAVKDFADENVSIGASDYPNWLIKEAQLRNQLVQFINAHHSDDIALVKNTSEALSMVAHGFPWNPGDNVVISDEEFPSNRVVWQSLQRFDVSVRQVSLKVDNPEAALIEAADGRTRIISISSVQYASGLRLDLVRLGQMCQKRNIAFCVDAIQGLGVFPHDVQAMHIDFLMADGHKWLLAPEAIAVFYCGQKWRDQMVLHEYGWHMLENHFDFSHKDWQPARSSRKFECGSPNMLGIYALSASLSLLMELSPQELEQRIINNSDHLIELIQTSKNLELITNINPGRYAGIVLFRHRSQEPEILHKHLSNHRVVCAQRGSGIRFSPHFYTQESTLQTAVSIAEDL